MRNDFFILFFVEPQCDRSCGFGQLCRVAEIISENGRELVPTCVPGNAILLFLLSLQNNFDMKSVDVPHRYQYIQIMKMI